jgi:acyl-CoA hydrolase
MREVQVGGEVVTAAEAARRLAGAGRILLAGCAAEPRAILSAVAADPGLWQGVTLTGAFIPGANDADFAAIGMRTRVETIFATAGLRAGGGAVAHLPLHYSAFWARLARPGVVGGVAMTVPPPRADGTVGFGAACDFAPAAIAAGALLVGAINPRMPDVARGPRLPRARFAALVSDDGPLPAFDPGRPDAATLAIADHVLSLLRPGDTLQLGLGRVQAAILARLAGSGLRGLGYHAGMITPGLLPLLDAGVIRAGAVTGTALGDAAFLAALAGRDDIRFAPVGQTHAQATLAAIPRLVAVNSVLEVDLTGQANGEALAGVQVSGQGGMVDFVRGARASDGGRAILALPATARGGRDSRIVARLPAGTPVTVARGDADLVVTEYGIADLREADLEERARRLAAIAAPAFRDALLRAARERP